MDDREVVQMMIRCQEEIESLQRRVQYLTPQVEAYDAIRQVLGLTRRNSMGSSNEGESVLWLLRDARKRLEASIELADANEALKAAEAKAKAKAEAEASVALKAAEVVIDTSSNRPTR